MDRMDKIYQAYLKWCAEKDFQEFVESGCDLTLLKRQEHDQPKQGEHGGDGQDG